MANGAPDNAAASEGAAVGPSTTTGAAAAAPAAEAVPGPLRLRQTLAGHTRAVASLKLSPVDGDLLASASADRSVRLWRLGGGDDSAAEASPVGGMQHAAGVNDIAWSPLGNYLASASDDTVVRIWDAETGACLRALPGHTNYAYCCQFDPAGRILATGSFDETLRFWDVRTGRLLRETPAHSDPVTCLSYSFDGTLLISGSFDGLVRVWDTRNGHCLRSYASSKDSAPVNDVSLSPNAKYYLQSTLDSAVRLIHLETGRVCKTYAGRRNEDYCCGVTFVAGLPERAPGGGPEPMDTDGGADAGGGAGARGAAGAGGGAAVAAVAGGSEDGSLCVWGLNSRKVMQRELGAAAGGQGHGAAALCITAHPARPVVVTGGQEPDCCIKVWSAE